MSTWEGITVKVLGEYGLVCDYDHTHDNYIYATNEGKFKFFNRAACELVDIPRAPEVAQILRESNYNAGTAYLSEEGWDIVSAWEENDHKVSAWEENDHKDLYQADPDGVAPGNDAEGGDLVWDPDSHTFVRVDPTEEEDTTTLYTPEMGGSDPNLRREWPKNPEFAGVFAKSAARPSAGFEHWQCPQCGAAGRDSVYEDESGFECRECGRAITGQDLNDESAPRSAVQPHKDQTTTYMDVDTRSGFGRDESFPSMISKLNAAVKSDMKNFAHIREELAWKEAVGPPQLDECPECGDFMLDSPDHKEAHCHACGHRQPIIYNESKQKHAFLAALAPVALRLMPMMGQAFGGGVPGGEGMQPEQLLSSAQDATVRSAADVGIAVDNSGRDVVPNAGNKGFTDDHGDSPEILKDVNDIGGTQGHEILDQIKQLMPKIKEYADDPSKSAAEDVDLVELDRWLAENVPGYERQHKASSMYHEAVRRPKMCPYHTNLVDYSLAMGDPALALRSLGGLMYSEQSCQGGYELLNKNGNPVKCKYKPEMIKPEYWEQKEQEAERRRLEREQQQALQPPTPQEAVQEEVQNVETTNPLEVVKEDEQSVTIPAEQLNEMRQEPEAEVPEVDAIELPTDYDPEAYWEDESVPDFGPPAMTADQMPPQEQFQVPEGYQLVPIMASAPEAPAQDVDYAQTQMQQNGLDLDGLRNSLLAQGMSEPRVTNAINKLVDELYGAHPHQQVARVANPMAVAPDTPEISGTDPETAGHIEPVTQEDPSRVDATTTHVTDSDGDALKVGGTYDMFNEGVDKLPEKVKITRVDPYYVEFEVINDGFDFTYSNRVHAKTIATEGIKFRKHVAHPNADGVAADQAPPEPANRTGDAPPDVTDLSTGRNASLAWLLDEVDDVVEDARKEASVLGGTDRDWLLDGMQKEAGKHYTPGEQRELISESGTARNLDKLQLDGTHYVEAATGDDDDELDASLLFT